MTENYPFKTNFRFVSSSSPLLFVNSVFFPFALHLCHFQLPECLEEAILDLKDCRVHFVFYLTLIIETMYYMALRSS